MQLKELALPFFLICAANRCMLMVQQWCNPVVIKRCFRPVHPKPNHQQNSHQSDIWMHKGPTTPNNNQQQQELLPLPILGHNLNAQGLISMWCPCDVIVGWRWMLLDDVGCCWMLLEDVGCCWMLLECLMLEGLISMWCPCDVTSMWHDISMMRCDVHVKQCPLLFLG